MSDKKKNKPIKASIDFMRRFFDPLLNPDDYDYDEDKIYKREIVNDPPKIKQSIKLKGAGRNEKAGVSDFLPFIKECIQKEVVETSIGKYRFLTRKDRKVKPGTIARYLWNHTDPGQLYSDEKQIREKHVPKALAKISSLEKREDGYFYKKWK